MNYPNPCDTCEHCKDLQGCAAWQIRFKTIWKQFNSYPARIYKAKKTAQKTFAYEHPDLLKRYLDNGPCKGCEFELLCDVPCTAYWGWWDARMAVLKKKYGTE